MSFFLRGFRRWRRAGILSRFPIDRRLWLRVVGELDVLAGLTQAELGRLYSLAVLFVHEKRYFGTHELEIDDYKRVVISAQACLLVLNLTREDAVEVYPGWRSIILYPGAFVARHEYRDEVGVVHERVMALEGEASDDGPVVISWDDARSPVAPGHDGRNVVIHEFAHKLDYLDGKSNGHPPLHGNMSSAQWSRVFLAAFGHLNDLVNAGHRTPINPYAATNPAEFFAVATEMFFELPHHLQRAYPEVYAQLALFYRQDPAGRVSGCRRI